MTEPKGKNLITKLAEACNAVSGVEKRGRNAHQNYNYVKAADVAKAIRHELFSRGIVVVIDEKDFSKFRSIPTNGGHLIDEFLLKCEVSFHDDQTKLGPFGAFATAMDSGDKAIYKAKTAALKYVLRGIGLIPDELDDPEADQSVDERTAQVTAPPPPSPSSRPHRRTARATRANYQLKSWESTLRQYGKTAEQSTAYLKTRWNAANVTELSRDEFREAIRWAVGQEDLAQTLSTSVEIAERNKVNGDPHDEAGPTAQP